jgi:hypothetical protein
MAADDFNPGGSDSQFFGKESAAEAVGLPPLRRGGDPDSEEFALESCDLVPGGSGLNPEM